MFRPRTSAFSMAFACTVFSAAAFAQPTIGTTLLSPESRAALSASLLTQAAALEHGEGAVRDPAQAARLYCDAARLGNAEAQYSLGWMYLNGRGVERSERYAASLLSLAAAQGHAGALKAQAVVTTAAAGGNVAADGDLPACFAPPKPVLPVALDRAEEKAVPAAEITNAAAEDLAAYLATLPPDRRRIAELISLLAPKYGIDPKLALAVAAAESNFNIMARSPKGALGVMQLIPDTAARFGVKKPFDPGQNIRGGLAYLRWLLAYFEGDVLLTVAAYNAGEGAVNRFGGIPPYMETAGYVKRIYAFYRKPTHSFDASVTPASPMLRANARVAER